MRSWSALFSSLPRSVRDSARQPRVWLIVGLLAAILLAIAGLWLFQALPPAIDPAWERIQETGVLLVCTDPSWPPFESIDEDTGQLQGFDVDLARTLASRLVEGSGPNSVQARFVTVGFDSLYDALLSGRCDVVLSALPYEAMRTEDVTYSMSYFNGGQVLVTPEDSPDITEVEDLADRVVGVEWGFVPEGDSHQRLFFRSLGLRRYETAEGALRALQAGELEAVVVDRISALTYLRDCQGLRIAGDPIADLSFIIPLRPENYRLIEEVDRVLLEMLEDGTLQELQRIWF